MKVSLLGGGLMGMAILHDLIHVQYYEEIQVVEKNNEKIEYLWKRFQGQHNLSFIQMDITDFEKIGDTLLGSDIIISALPYEFNYNLLEVALKIGAHFIDLGGNDEILQKQLQLNEKAEKQKLIAFPACGLAPGLVSILAADGIRELSQVENIKLYCGGLPQKPQPPLNYQIVFSPHGLLNEYLEPVHVIENGKVIEKPPLSGLEIQEFPDPYGKIEAFLTSGGTGTLIHTMRGVAKNLFYKTLRYPGHAEKFKFLFDLGFDSEERFKFESGEVSPREMLEKILEIKLSSNDPDLVLLRVIVEGKKGEEDKRFVYEIIELMDEVHNLTAMMRTTGFSAAIVAQLIAEGKINKYGVLPLEMAIPTQEFFQELERREIILNKMEF